MQKWEYFVLSLDDLYYTDQNTAQYIINSYGENGWELISVTAFHNISGTIDTPSYTHTEGSTTTQIYTKLFFKRPKP